MARVDTQSGPAGQSPGVGGPNIHWSRFGIEDPPIILWQFKWSRSTAPSVKNNLV